MNFNNYSVRIIYGRPLSVVGYEIFIGVAHSLSRGPYIIPKQRLFSAAPRWRCRALLVGPAGLTNARDGIS